MMVSISVVIPAYNASPFIEETLESVFVQTQLPKEVIVVDDCSTDATYAVVNRVAASAPVPVRLLRTKSNTGGPADPANLGISACGGDLIAMLDHDDLMQPDRLRTQLSAFKACPDAGLVLGRCEGMANGLSRDTLPDRGWEAMSRIPATQVVEGVMRISANDAYLGLILDRCFALTCSTFFFPRSTWRKVGGFDPTIQTACDLDFLERVTRKHAIAYVNSAVCTWRSRADNLYTRSTIIQRLKDEWAVISRFRRNAANRSMQLVAKQQEREFLFGASFAVRQQGLIALAAAYLLKSMFLLGPDVRTVWALAKLGPNFLRDAFK